MHVLVNIINIETHGRAGFTELCALLQSLMVAIWSLLTSKRIQCSPARTAMTSSHFLKLGISTRVKLLLLSVVLSIQSLCPVIFPIHTSFCLLSSSVLCHYTFCLPASLPVILLWLCGASCPPAWLSFPWTSRGQMSVWLRRKLNGSQKINCTGPREALLFSLISSTSSQHAFSKGWQASLCCATAQGSL